MAKPQGTSIALLLLLPLLVSCGGRSGLSTARQAPRADGTVAVDLPHSDLTPPDAGAVDMGVAFCSGQSRFAINGQQMLGPVAVAKVGVTNLCNSQTFQVQLTTATGRASQDLHFYLCLDGVAPDASLIKMSALASHMARAMLVPCATSNCTLHHVKDADFSGQAAFNLKGASPGLTVDLCVEGKAKASAGSLKSFSIWIKRMELEQACQPGSDPSCNHSLMVSATRGKCEKDATCTCLPGAKKVLTSGKCL
mgnify:CR=1 FL=1